MNSGISSITFFFPYIEVSGVPVLFRRMAEYIAARYGIHTYVVDYSDGYMGRTLDRHSGASLIPFQDGEPVTIPADTVLILQAVLPYTMRPELQISASTRVVFWTLHPSNLIQTVIPLPWFRDFQSRHLWFHRFGNALLFPGLTERLRDLVVQMAENNAILFMDGVNFEHTTIFLGADVGDPVFVPVACDDVAQNKKLSFGADIDPSFPLSITWLGRLADFKIHILVYTLKRLSVYAQQTGRPIRFHVIGDGPDAALVRELDIEHDAFQVVWAGVLTGQDLDDYLVEETDVLIAMGTSALEGAKLGVPTILVDLAYGVMDVAKDYKYRWLFQSEGYVLGAFLSDKSFEQGNRTLESMVESLPEQYADLSAMTYLYCAENHFISAVSQTFLDTINQATFHYGDMDPKLLQKDPLRRLYRWWKGQSNTDPALQLERKST